ncbi:MULTISPECIES: hypothetical protein [Priestia]|jgi:hypothetical protein|uniref:hypothetical protein n=1 Tax=Priestia TaxID=2800373 RepID=UPI0004029BCB|nr:MULTISPECIES: hypothetical protein [Priestia]MBK0006137.1 hypothetical protein [Bacillus sp. S35]MCM3254991.1 hypothetical protein [Priestia aryabhattai]MCM3639997.1 hypothetical protein [Priestia aryabhattai]PFW74475.1 hypothetical protein COL23_17940 [Priestia aryabhattai]
MGNNQSNDLEQVSENNTDETELGDLEKEFVTKPSDPYPHKYYTGDTSMVSNGVRGNDKE